MRAQVSRVRRVKKCLIAGVAIFTVKTKNGNQTSFSKSTHWSRDNSFSQCILIVKNCTDKDLRLRIMWDDQYFANRYVLNRIEYTELFLFHI